MSQEQLTTQRRQNRQPSELRKVKIDIDVNRYAEGSCLISYGDTKVLCTASLEEGVPRWMQGKGSGWVSAEYGMLPRSTHTRMNREKTQTGGRTLEISRLIARTLRSCVNMEKLGERMINVDCDVIQADGGTRTAAITGGYVALSLAIKRLQNAMIIEHSPLLFNVAAVSVGINTDGAVLVDLDYDEDSRIGTDMNIVMNSNLDFIEVQGTAEKGAFTRAQFDQMLISAEKACSSLFQAQNEALKS